MSQLNAPSRRDFVRTAGTAALGVSMLGHDTLRAAQPPARRRYAIVGTGERAVAMWGRDLVKQYADVIEFVGLCDVNPKRVDTARQVIGVSCPTFTSFDEMCDRARPDLVMVTTVDGFHSEYLVKALDRGIDAMTEKPMVIDEAQCQAVIDAERRNNRKIVVTHNYRYAPAHQKIKELILEGAIGRVLSVDFSWYLDVYHGADYFRRWHRLRSAGGSLLVHKSSHHFDLMNWWLDADPVEVSARGSLQVYGKQGPFRHAGGCRPCPHKTECAFYYDMTRNPRRMQLYAANQDADGYLRDGCVFREDVDIFDTMAALVQYSNGATMSYTLNAAMPYEGYSLGFNGDRGRIDVRSYERQPWSREERHEIYLTKNFGDRVAIEIPQVTGGHGGGDDRLRDLMFRKADAPDYMRLPDSRAGAMSCLTGIAARKSIDERRAIRVADLVRFT